MYSLFEPHYRQRVDFTAFVPQNIVRTRFQIISHQIVELIPEGPERVRVKLQLRFNAPKPGGVQTSTTEETWVMLEQQWFKQFQTPALPFPTERGTKQAD